jgi:nucleotide-binding universal stress UspA family protein
MKMNKVLLAVDGSECSDRAVSWVIGVVQAMNKPAEVHVVTVQPAIRDGLIRSFVSSDAIETYQREEGDKRLASARKLLDAAGTAYVSHILLGPIGPAIGDFAAQNACDGIVMGTRGLGGVSGLVLGSVATQVLQVATVPVTLIK